MINRDVYQVDPSTRKLVNEGVANVNDDRSKQALEVLRYELETFVCEGQYAKGLEVILETYLRNLDQAEQPAVWVSGFYGSGKSHLVKMLRALWLDTKFEDGATARGVANLPQSVKDLLLELSNRGKRFGGLHAASGTLGAGAAGSIRLALLRILFKSLDLPTLYPAAQFVLWLKGEGLLQPVRDSVEKSGSDWTEELDNFYVAEGLFRALVAIKPDLFPSMPSCAETLNNLYPNRPDISSDEMVRTIKQALSKEKRLPLTLVIMDEMQQFIGDDSTRSLNVQELVETCCKQIGSRLLFIGTGQTALSNTSNLKKLEGRFTVRIHLSDTDVDAVVRQVLLLKKPEAKALIEQAMERNLGEISRHLQGTTIGHHQSDISLFPMDYPILPARRRFWEHSLRALDPTGTDSQLRNQLTLVHKVINTNLDKPLGNVIPADYLFFDAAEGLLQSGALPRTVYHKAMVWRKGDSQEQLMARACGLVFLINRLSGSNKEIGIRATIHTIADLLVEDLPEGSSTLRANLPAILDHCELLMKVEDEYRIQTEESAAWNDEFRNQQSQLANAPHTIEMERDQRFRQKLADMGKKLSFAQGNSKVAREIGWIFNASLPADSVRKVCVWVRDGWSSDENSVRIDARQAGAQSPTVFVFIPNKSSDNLRRNLIDFKASATTLEKRGSPLNAEGIEARAAIETIRQMADRQIDELLADALDSARVFQAGGNEIIGSTLLAALQEAVENSAQRLYPQFTIADHVGWARTYEKAQKGAPDALKTIGFDGAVAQHPVCKMILGFLGAGKKGADLRTNFESPPFGWPRDAIDGSLQVLLVAGLIRAKDDHGHPVDPLLLDRAAIGKTMFTVESAVVTTEQNIALSKLMLKLGVQSKPGERVSSVPIFLQKLQELATRSGGQPPRPALPDLEWLEQLHLTNGNELLLALFHRREEIEVTIQQWTNLAARIEKRWPSWLILQRLLAFVAPLPEKEVFQARAATIEQQRLLIDEPDPLASLIASIAKVLRERLNQLEAEDRLLFKEGLARLSADRQWNQLDPEQCRAILIEQKLTEEDRPRFKVETTEDVLQALESLPLPMFADRVLALPGRFDQALMKAAKLLQPKVQRVALPHRTLSNEAEIAEWLQEVAALLKEKLKDGPVIP